MIPPHPATAAMWGNKTRKEKRNMQRKYKKRRRTKSLNAETSRFRVVYQENQFKWELSDAMTVYVNEHLNIFIQEKNLKESILKTIPVPSNVQEVRHGSIYGTTTERETTENLTSPKRYL